MVDASQSNGADTSVAAASPRGFAYGGDDGDIADAHRGPLSTVVCGSDLLADAPEEVDQGDCRPAQHRSAT